MASININLGELKTPIEIQRIKQTTDDMGFMVEEYQTICKTRAKVEFDDRLMREVFRNDGADSTTVKIFTFRYFPGLTVRDRILLDGVSYNIYGLYNINEANRFYKVWGRAIWE